MSLTIKRRLLVTVLSIFFASTAFMGFFTYSTEMDQLQQNLRGLARNQTMLFQNILSTDAKDWPGRMPALPV